MFMLLAESRFFNYFHVYYELLGAPGLVAGALFFAVLVVCSLSRKGVHFLFLLFLMASMMSSSDAEAVARTASISVFRYLLLFPLFFWGVVTLFFLDKKVGQIGWMLLVYCLLYVPGWILNSYVGGARLLGQFLLWFAIVVYLSGKLKNIEDLKDLLGGMGWMCWLTVIIAIGFIFIAPSDSFMDGRLRSLWHRPNSFAISMFFVLIVLCYRVFLMDKNTTRPIDILCLLLSLLMMVMSGTRSAGVAAAIMLIPFIKGKSAIYFVLSIAFFAIFAGVVLTVPALREMAFERFVPSSEMDTAGRTELWANDFRYALDKPLFGHGLGDVTEATELVGHNSYISIAVEAGFIAMIWFVLICLTVTLKSFRKTRMLENRTDKKLGYHITFSIVGILFICFFESIASGIGGAGITIIWLIFQCEASLVPANQYQIFIAESEGYDSLNASLEAEWQTS